MRPVPGNGDCALYGYRCRSHDGLINPFFRDASLFGYPGRPFLSAWPGLRHLSRIDRHRSSILRRGLTPALRISCAQDRVTVYRDVFPGIGYCRHFHGRFYPIRPERLCDWLQRELGSFDGIADRPDENHPLCGGRALLRAQRCGSHFLYAIGQSGILCRIGARCNRVGGHWGDTPDRWSWFYSWDDDGCADPWTDSTNHYLQWHVEQLVD